MLNINEWLTLLALIAFMLQGFQLKKYSSSWYILVLVVLPASVCAGLSDFLILQSVTVLQQQLLTKIELISVIVLLEAFFIFFLTKDYKLPLVSMLTTLIYGQMLFYQMGWFSWSFTIQGIIYGLVVSLALTLIINLCKKVIYLEKVLIITLLGITLIQTAQWPLTQQTPIESDFQSLIYSLTMISILILMGYVFTRVYYKFSHRHEFKTKSDIK